MVFRPLAPPAAFPDLRLRRAAAGLVRRHGSDTLAYFKEDPIGRRYHHHKLTFRSMYFWSENYVRCRTTRSSTARAR